MAVHFEDDEHAIVTGYLLGMLMKAGITAYPTTNEDGSAAPIIRLSVDLGHSQPMDVELEVTVRSVG